MKAQQQQLPTSNDIAVSFEHHLNMTLADQDAINRANFLYYALVSTLREKLIPNWRQTRAKLDTEHVKVAYLSMEFLIGRNLRNALLNMDLLEPVQQVLDDYSSEIEVVEGEELDAGLGNGGLGRLAACFLDSCATLDIPVTGYGLRYQFGMFHQALLNGHQIEKPDLWLRHGNLWEIKAEEHTQRVKFFGHTETYTDDQGRRQSTWVNTRDVLAIPFDMPIPGYQNGRVNTLRLWKSEATDEFNFNEFNAGDYSDAVTEKNLAEQITMVLYPNDCSVQGKELRLRQQYFLVSASLQDILQAWVAKNGRNFDEFAERHAIQLNDTHPAMAVPELMRLLLDEYKLGWEQAWTITKYTMAYTNHTLLPEALERWSVQLFGTVLPRILEIIYEINARFLSRVSRQWPGDMERLRRMSIIAEGEEQTIRMSHLAIIGSFSVNGVAELHTNLLQQGLFRDFYQLWPKKFNNKTNGVTPRRWLSHCNPNLKSLICETIGTGWVRNLDELTKLLPHVDDKAFQDRFMAVKRANKERLMSLVSQQCDIDFDPQMIFDVQVKRIHEYKRQLLNVLHVIHMYECVLNGETTGLYPRCVLFGGKAAPGYTMAKLIVKFINNVAKVINQDPRVNQWLRVAFFPDYQVTAMERICPGTDLSEQISTAGKEASGTGNMKFMMNGAVTIGTLDGANIEIRESVGADNFFLFGMTADQVETAKSNYNPNQFIESDDDLSRVMQLIESGHFNLFEDGLFDPIIGAIRSSNDPWMVAGDFRSYIDAQYAVNQAFAKTDVWSRMSIMNTACSGKFSSDRTIQQYRDEIWYR